MRLLALFFIFFAQFAVAQIYEPAGQLRQMVYDGDIDGAEHAMRQAHQDSLNGAVKPSELRTLARVLEATHPDTLAFLEAWQAAYPDSIYAEAARIDQRRSFALRVRGSGYASEIAGEALQTFRDAQNIALDDALSLYQKAPDYLIASDLIFQLNAYRQRFDRNALWEILSRVMQTVPNLGSLKYASTSLDPSWRGEGFHRTVDMCNAWADDVPDIDDYTVDVCVVDLIFWNLANKEERAFAYRFLDGSNHPNTLRARAWYTVDNAVREDVDVIFEYLDSIYWYEDTLINNTKYHFGKGYPDDAEMADYWETLRKEMEWGIQHDPYNVGYLELAFLFHDRELRVTPDAARAPERLAEMDVLARRYIAAAPFSGDAWARSTHYLPHKLIGEIDDIPVFLDYVDRYHNSIIYNQYHVDHFAGYMRERTDAVRWVQRVEDLGFENPLSHSQIEAEIMCPFVRAARLFDAICEASRSDMHRMVRAQCFDTEEDFFARNRAEAMEIATARNFCEYEFNEPLEDLLYSPVEIDLGDLEVGMANR